MIEPYYKQNGITIYNADCRDVLPELETFDLLLTDPPYGLGERLKGSKGKWQKGFSINPLWDLKTVSGVEEMPQKAIKSIIWGGNYYKLKPVRCWLSWDKMQEHTSGHFELAWTNLDKPTRCFRMSRVEAYGKGKTHPTQKPLPLMQWCIKQAGDGINTILDPFMGSGTTLVAAKLEGKEAVGIELDESYCESAAKRLEQGVLFAAEV